MSIWVNADLSSGESLATGSFSLNWGFFIFFFHASVWAFSLARHLNSVTGWFLPQFPHLGMTCMYILPIFTMQQVIPHLWISTLGAPAQITHCNLLSLNALHRSYSISAKLMQIELGLASEYFSTSLRALPNLNPFEHTPMPLYHFPLLLQ